MDSFISYDSKNIVSDVMDAKELDDVKLWYHKISQISPNWWLVDEIPNV